MSKIVQLTEEDLKRAPMIEVLYPYQDYDPFTVSNVRRLNPREIVIRVGGFRIPVHEYNLHTSGPRESTVITMTGAPVVIGTYEINEPVPE